MLISSRQIWTCPSAWRRSTSDVVRRASKGAQGPTPGTLAAAGPNADPLEVARTIVLRSLTAAPRTRQQLADLLDSRGIPSAVADTLLDRFAELNLVDDAEFARMWVNARTGHRGMSRRALRVELQRKGVAEADISAALAAIDDDTEFETAVTLARRKARTLAGQDARVRQRRLIGMLMRRGYSGGVAAKAAGVALDDEDHEGDEFGDG